jgi:asparagine synthase (glutamine-hydrolysing)
MAQLLSLPITDPRTQQVHLWTDQFGYHPVFVYGLDVSKPTAFTTFPDAIRRDPQADASEDEVSMAEFVNSWRTTPPNTYYKFLKHAGAASHWTWDLPSGHVDRKVYWTPFQQGFYGTLNDASEALASALSTAVRERTEMVSKSLLFVSGGSDSRVMLYGADDPKKLCGVNIYEVEPTNESKISRALCERIGVQYIGTGRDNDYYPRMLAENVRWSGAMWSGEDSHYLGLRELVMQQRPELVMTACTADWLFKGYGIEKTYKELFGRCLPIKKFLDKRVEGFLPNYPRQSPPQLAEAISQRLQAWFDGCPTDLKSDLDHLVIEDRRIRPACYTVSVSGQLMYRVYPYDTFLADSRVAECYGKMPAKWKLNGEAWGQAAGIICAKASDIVDSNFGWRVDASIASRLIGFTQGWIKRRLPKRLSSKLAANKHEDHPNTSASWPDYGWYALHSPTLKELWSTTSHEHREKMTRIWGSNPWDKPLEQWSRYPLDLFRIMTLLQHWRSCYR